ncbi:Inositol phospholipid synthesis protein, Scs3p [Ceraceosorus bombacis]|uniref:Inositol phospholipid synthesis protein, Scs3p n=1 Tax=Ceraceosorus bombacis TaxID=401625 RepID=A0A0P1BC65_9BASI|nr:Inositol phospholipid synthesis protein, Scs3p [Ceraceosorus bombacis]
MASARVVRRGVGVRDERIFGLAPQHVLVLGIPLCIVAVGTFHSVLSGSHLSNLSITSASLTQTQTQSIPTADSSAPEPPLSYFADRRNLLNVVFIKNLWAWTTLAWFLQAITLRAAPSLQETRSVQLAQNKKRRDDGTIVSPLARSAFRYAIATTTWREFRIALRALEREQATCLYALERPWMFHASAPTLCAPTLLTPALTTLVRVALLPSNISSVLFAAWFFGPSLTTRLRVWTGATCVPASIITAAPGIVVPPGGIDPIICLTGKGITPASHPTLFSAATLSGAHASGGVIRPKFRGGHDLSGHTFILILSSLLLVEDLLPYLSYLIPSIPLPRSLRASRNPFSSSSKGSSNEVKALINRSVAYLILLVILLEWFCLLNTALFFHTPQEKVSGFAAGVLGWALLPKGG